MDRQRPDGRGAVRRLVVHADPGHDRRGRQYGHNGRQYPAAPGGTAAAAVPALAVAWPWLQREMGVILLMRRREPHAVTSVSSERARFQTPLPGVSSGASM